MNERHGKYLQREILLSFWKLHILHHAAEKPLLGQWMLEELRHHGYSVSPGTLYPMLHRLEERGFLRVREERTGRTMRRFYRATPKGKAAFQAIKPQVRELFEELIKGHEPGHHRRRAK